MKNEIVISITASQGEVYGLTETGKLVFFDKSAGMFVLKCPSDILTMDKANVLKKIEPNIVQDSRHQGRYRTPATQPIEAPSRIKTMLTPVNISIGLIGLALLLYWFVR